jgi:enolase
MGGFLGTHNKITKVLDPIGIVPKVSGSNDPLDLFGGATTAAEKKTAKDVAALKTAQEQEMKTNYKNKYGVDLVGSV